MVNPPYTSAERKLLERIGYEVERGLTASRQAREDAQLCKRYYQLDNRDLVPRRPGEGIDAYGRRPRVASSMTKRAVDVLSEHQYCPGPTRQVEDPVADKWLAGVYRDILVNTLMQRADRYAVLNGSVAIQAYATGDPKRPVDVYLWDRDEFEPYPVPGDSNRPFAVVTIAREDERTTYTIWTRHEARVYRTARPGESWGGGRIAVLDPAASGDHPYGCLPFTLVSNEIVLTGLTALGQGPSLAEANALVDIKLSNLAEAVEFAARPIGLSKNVRAGWSPTFVPGGFIDLPGRGGNVRVEATGGVATREKATTAATAGAGEPELSYLTYPLDISGLWGDVVATINGCYEDNGVPLTAVRLEGNTANSGYQIVVEQAPLLIRAANRRESFRHFEAELARVCLRVGGGYYEAPALVAAADDLQLTVIWAEPRIPIPGPDRDADDEGEVLAGYASRIEILMRRRGLTHAQAVAHLERVEEDNAILARIKAKFRAKADASPDPPAAEPAQDDSAGIDDEGPDTATDLPDEA